MVKIEDFSTIAAATVNFICNHFYNEKSKETNESLATFDEADVRSIRNACLKGQPGYRGVDILLASAWPCDIANKNQTTKPPVSPGEAFPPQGSRLLSWLSANIKPRYHLAALENIYFERSPYRNENESGEGIEIATRFIALAKVGNAEGRKWLYALNLTPVDHLRLTELAMKTTDETAMPYPKELLHLDSEGAKQKATKRSQFFFDMDAAARDGNAGSRNRPPVKKAKFDQEKCWFCLSSSQVSRHLVVSVGKEVYVALAKGGVVDDHLLILPIGHYRNSALLPDSVAEEMEKYQEAVARYYASNGCVAVFFERNFKSSHCQIQSVPVPKRKALLLKSTFKDLAVKNGFGLVELTSRAQLKQLAPERTLYFYAQLPSGEKLFYRIKKDFPLQFGRQVLVDRQILDLQERADWRSCITDDDREAELANRIRKSFAPFEPSSDAL